MGLVLVEFDQDRREKPVPDDKRAQRLGILQEWLSKQTDLSGITIPASDFERVHPPLRKYPDHEERGMHTPKYNVAIEVQGATPEEAKQRVVALCQRIEASKILCHAEGFG